MLVTQTCDLDYRKHYQIVPVRPLAELENDRKRQSLRNGEIGYLYHLPARPPEITEDSYADLTLMTSVHKSYFSEGTILCRLTNAERSYFQHSLANFHGSPFGFNTRDTVLLAGRYGCVNCFHAGGHQTSEIQQGGQFPKCALCGEDALWVQIAG